MLLPSVRVGLRLARRDLRARPARAALVVLLIIVPTAAMTVVTTFYRTSEVSWRDLRAATYGTAAGRAYFTGPISEDSRFIPDLQPTDADIQNLRDALPGGTPILIERNALDRVRTKERSDSFSLVDVDVVSPLARGKYELVSGRAPRNDGEAVIGQELARRLQLHLGSTVRPERLGVAQRIVGVMTAGGDYQDILITHAPLPPRGSTNVFIGASRVRPKVDGWTIEYGKPIRLSRTDSVVWTYVGGAIGMFALGTIVAAAFALGARRQLRTIGLLSASGAAPRTVGWVLTAQGVSAGVIGSAIGIAIGVLGVHLMPIRLLQSITTHFAASPVVHPLDLVPIAVIGVTAATSAAALPARAASRIPVLQALASRRPVNRAKRGTLTLALATLAFSAGILAWTVRYSDPNQSTAATAAVVLASVLPFASVLIAAPVVVSRLEQWVRKAPLSWRLAGRSLARNRARSASVIGATCAVVGVAAAGATLASSWSTQVDASSSVGAAVLHHAYLQPNQALIYSQQQAEPDQNGNIPELTYQPAAADETVVARAERVLSSALRIDLDELRGTNGLPPHYRLDTYDAGPNFGPTPLLAVATPELLEVFDASSEIRRLLAAGDAVVVQSPGVSQRRSEFEPADGATMLHVGGVIESDQAALALPRILISPARAVELRWHTVPAGATVLVSTRNFTPHERRQLALLGQDLNWEQTVNDLTPPGSVVNFTNVDFGQPPSAQLTSYQIRLLAFAATAVLVLTVVALGLGLAARDSQDETAVLDATGAPPRMRRQVGTRRAVLLVTIASAIAIPAGLTPVAALITASTRTDFRFQVDWPALFALAVVLPAVVGAVSAAGGWLRDRLRSRRMVEIAFAD